MPRCYVGTRHSGTLRNQCCYVGADVRSPQFPMDELVTTDPVQQSIVELLQSCTQWREVETNASYAEQVAQEALVRAGMLEARIHRTLTLDRESLLLKLVVSGQYSRQDLLTVTIKSLPATWRRPELESAWVTDSGYLQLRRTDEGDVALQDLVTKRDVVLGFVLRTGLFAFRADVAGTVHLERREHEADEKTGNATAIAQASATVGDVNVNVENVVNVDKLGSVLAETLRTLQSTAPIPPPKKTKSALTINELMFAEIGTNPKCIGWTAVEWANRLDCGKTSVINSAAWAALKVLKAYSKDERRGPTE